MDRTPQTNFRVVWWRCPVPHRRVQLGQALEQRGSLFDGAFDVQNSQRPDRGEHLARPIHKVVGS